MRSVCFPSIIVLAMSFVLGSLAEARAAEADERSILAEPVADDVQSLMKRYCLDCHTGPESSGGLQLEALLPLPAATKRVHWEKVVRKLSTRQMPPADASQPSDAERQSALQAMSVQLEALWNANPNLGTTPTFRRLTRTEYAYAIRDLFQLSLDAEDLLPADETSHGFDNITVNTLSPALLQRYLSAAQTISRRVIGRAGVAPESVTFRVRPDVTQDTHLPGFPVGTRGGISVSHYFPRSGVYEVQIHLMRDRNEEVEGLREPHDLELLLDKARINNWTIHPPQSSVEQKAVDSQLKATFHVPAGSHQVAATFVQLGSSLLETKRQPLHVHFNFYRHPRQGPAVYQMTISGPLDASEHSPDSPTRLALVGSDFDPSANAMQSARAILQRVMRIAYRRPLTEEDFRAPLSVFKTAQADGAEFDEALEASLAAVLVSPHFLFRVERASAQTTPGSAFRVSDLELASRLSFFLWSSLPDDLLLKAAEQGQLRSPEQLELQVRRMLADSRSRAIVDNFGSQWLQLRNLDAVTPDMRLYPDFDDNLRQAMRKETELLLESILREDRSILDLFRTDETFLNERLADHYGIPHVQGSHFRRVALASQHERGGVLRHASILTVTSYATRTSPVLRGKWVLENLLASPPPPPPPNVPALDDTIVAANLPVRKRLEQHRANEACAHCHQLIDPVGFCFEHYDAIGHWRELEEGQPIDARGGLTGSPENEGVRGVELGMHQQPELFVQGFAEKMLVFALGRTLEYEEMVAVRKVVREARSDEYRFSAIVLGIVRSDPFQMRRAD